jgi:hypothetical protein
LSTSLIHGVERVKELFLRGLFSSEEVNVIDKQQVGFTISAPKVVHGALRDGGDDVVRELFCAYVHHAAVWGPDEDLMRNGLHEVRFSEPRGTVNEQGVVGFAWRLRDSGGCGGGELIGTPNDELSERITIIEKTQNNAVVTLCRRYSGAILRYKKVHLRPRQSFSLNPKRDLDGMAEAKRAITLEQRTMLALVPLDRPLIGCCEYQFGSAELHGG